MAAGAAVEVVRDVEQAAVLLHPLRLRILGELAQPASAATVARRLGTPRQTINYHFRELEREGLVELVDERRKGNTIERLLRASARSYLISPEALGALAADPALIQDRFSSAYLVAVAARAISDLAALRERAAGAGKRLATFALQTEIRFASAGARRAFIEELASEVARLTAKYHDEGVRDGRRFSLFVGAHPATAQRSGSDAPARSE